MAKYIVDMVFTRSTIKRVHVTADNIKEAKTEAYKRGDILCEQGGYHDFTVEEIQKVKEG